MRVCVGSVERQWRSLAAALRARSLIYIARYGCATADDCVQRNGGAGGDARLHVGPAACIAHCRRAVSPPPSGPALCLRWSRTRVAARGGNTCLIPHPSPPHSGRACPGARDGRWRKAGRQSAPGPHVHDHTPPCGDVGGDAMRCGGGGIPALPGIPRPLVMHAAVGRRSGAAPINSRGFGPKRQVPSRDIHGPHWLMVSISIEAN